MYDSGVALAGLACFVTPDLARDLSPDIVNLVSRMTICWRWIDSYLYYSNVGFIFNIDAFSVVFFNLEGWFEEKGNYTRDDSNILGILGIILGMISSSQLTSSRPYTRKRAVLMLYKIFLKYPEALRPTFPRLKERLEDPDPGMHPSFLYQYQPFLSLKTIGLINYHPGLFQSLQTEWTRNNSYLA